MKTIFFFCAIFYFISLQTGYSQTGSINEPVRYVGGTNIDPRVHDGGLRYAIGVESRQTVRVNRTHPELVDGNGWTYSHASNLCYWNNTFYQQYLSNPVDEHIAPGQTLITTSKDGRNWTKPVIIFPPYKTPDGVKIPEGYSGYMMHQRMGFYVTPSGKLLVLAFYGHAEDPFTVGGIGRVVREAYKDGSFGPIYFIRYTSHANWNEVNTSYPSYNKSSDKEFIKACDALLADPLITAQWWDEDRGLDGFFNNKKAREALSYFHRKDGNVVALYKRSACALSFDGGANFSNPVRVPTLRMAGGKVWGQRTDDNRFAMSYNPIELDEHRYPLIVISGDDGIIFDDMLIVQGEVPPRRFYGRWKDFGPCYVRGIVEGNGNPPGNDMWLTYSMNKEDIWVSRIPVPIRYKVESDVNDDFETMKVGENIDEWNIYAPKWAPVNVVEFAASKNKCLQLKDKDRYDYARAIRVFKESKNLALTFSILTENSYTERIEIDITDRFGNRPVRICFDKDGKIKANNGNKKVVLQSYGLDKWHKIKIIMNTANYGTYSLLVDGKSVLDKAQFSESVKSVERISFRTGAYRDLPNRNTPNQDPYEPLEDGDDPVPTAVFYVDDVSVREIALEGQR